MSGIMSAGGRYDRTIANLTQKPKSGLVEWRYKKHLIPHDGPTSILSNVPILLDVEFEQVHLSKSRELIGADEGPDGGPDGARRRARRGQTGCLTGQTGLDGVPDGSHVIGHVIFECHVIRLGWQGVILLPTLLSQP
jgi:hypothetical protein